MWPGDAYSVHAVAGRLANKHLPVVTTASRLTITVLFDMPARSSFIRTAYIEPLPSPTAWRKPRLYLKSASEEFLELQASLLP